jgi:hypothetical protein
MRLTVFAILLFLFSGYNAHAQRDLIEWNDTLELKIEDYKGFITDTLHHVASSCGIYCIPQIVGDTASVTIIAYFDRNKSWIRKKKVTPLLLQHEKGHFDMTEIFARKLKKRILALKTNKRTFIKDVEKVYSKTWEDLQKQNEAYDKATDFSNIEFAQRTWQNYIKENLVLYMNYATTTIRFPIRD